MVNAVILKLKTEDRGTAADKMKLCQMSIWHLPCHSPYQTQQFEYYLVEQSPGFEFP